jgi:hypothetical protein
MKLIKLLLCIWSLITVVTVSTVSQTGTQDVFSPIASIRRARLAQRLNLLIEYQKTKQWEKQYGLLAELITRSQSKRDFVDLTHQAYSKWGRTPLLEFIPLKVTLQPVDATRSVWFISGCSLVLEKGQKIRKGALVEAYWERNDWFFSEVQNVGKGDKEDPCFTRAAERLVGQLPVIESNEDVGLFRSQTTFH